MFVFVVYVDWCGFCKVIKFIFEKVFEEFFYENVLVFIKVNIDI